MTECKKKQTHDHEFLGSTMLAELTTEPHNHRFAGVSSQKIETENGHHVHKIKVRTDFFADHFHKIIVTTGEEVDVGNDKHVHFVQAVTTEVDEHTHDLIFATLIENPISEEEEEEG